MALFLTFKSYFRAIESIHDFNVMLGRHLFAVIVEFLAFIAPFITWGINLRWGSGSLNTFCPDDDLLNFYVFNSLNGNKESVVVQTSKLHWIFSLTNTIWLWKTLTTIFSSKKCRLFKNFSFILFTVFFFLSILFKKILELWTEIYRLLHLAKWVV